MVGIMTKEKISMKNIAFIALSAFGIVAGVAFIVLGGMDDAPGAQVIGAVIAVAGIVGVLKTLRKNSVKNSSTAFLQTILVVLGVGVLLALIAMPQFEGRNVDATLFEIYFNDPFLAYVYLGAIPFFVGMYQAFKILSFVAKNNTFSHATVKALRTIKYCSFITAGTIIAADVFLVIHARLYPEIGAVDGPEGAVMLGLITTFASVVIGTAAAVFERVVQNAVDIKSENDLTV